jgi:hypothetical protein
MGRVRPTTKDRFDAVRFKGGYAAPGSPVRHSSRDPEWVFECPRFSNLIQAAVLMTALVEMTLSVPQLNAGSIDFSNTAVASIALPPGFTATSSSGITSVFLPVPDPDAIALWAVGLCALGCLVLRQRVGPKRSLGAHGRQLVLHVRQGQSRDHEAVAPVAIVSCQDQLTKVVRNLNHHFDETAQMWGVNRSDHIVQYDNAILRVTTLNHGEEDSDA